LILLLLCCYYIFPIVLLLLAIKMIKGPKRLAQSRALQTHLSALQSLEYDTYDRRYWPCLLPTSLCQLVLEQREVEEVSFSD
jgi:hypothetical protein